jgi:GNAT superfamily N-acetyltransferase
VRADLPSDLRLEVLHEPELGEQQRAELAGLLSACFGEVDVPSASTSPLVPHLRIVGRDPDGRPVVHQAVRLVPLLDNPRPVAALGDLCVHPDVRGQGLARRAIERGVAAADGLAAVVLTRTTVVADVFASLGFVRADQRVLALRDDRWDPVSDVWAKANAGLLDRLHLSSALF